MGLIDKLMVINEVIEDKIIVIAAVREWVGLVEAKQIRTFMVVVIVLIMS